MNVVYVLAPDGTPLMPCSCAIARLLLKDGKAKVKRRTPFTIKLLAQPETTYTQPLTLGIDTGSAVIGSAVATEQGQVVYLSLVTVRNDIASTMKTRAKYRRNRRNRKTRYRPARWLNRKNSIKKGRFSPTEIAAPSDFSFETRRALIRIMCTAWSKASQEFHQLPLSED